MEDVTKPEAKKKGVKYFGTFQGVFTPTVLTILGVIMYIRHPWVVGNAGVVGAVLILAISISITLFTSLSMATMVTNIRIGSGGAFSIISQSLGLEIGGSIGIPLYFSQACVVAMYIFGFREGWLWIFPDHPPLLIDFLTFSLIALIAGISADVAFKIQYFIMAIILGSIFQLSAGCSPLRLILRRSNGLVITMENPLSIRRLVRSPVSTRPLSGWYSPSSFRR